ncbi:P-loop containing nucleoside triphosphate hydrolase protein, partial [Kickxella alabastrina]|uniref:P-loop containing nucleoside triphosphate hydrolase protein n=1 Tax=Kickxella alabastrina TaxID=61397 RepID=UPI0022204C2D
KLMSDEERLTGQISVSTYLAYIHAGGGFALFSMVLLCLAISQGCRIGSDFWMRLWIRHRHDAGATHTYIWVYALFGGLQLLWFGLFAVLLVATVYKSSKWLHSRALHRVAHSPMSFFDTTPLGRILNRFTRDVDSLDLALCDFFRQFYQNISRSIGSFVSISILVPIFLIPLVPLFSLSWALIYVYLRTSVEIQRVAAISRSPLYSHYAETLQGLATIRAFNAQNRYVSMIERALDDANRPQWYALVVQNWVWLRVDLLSHLLSLVVCLIVVAQPARWDAAAVGLLLIQATQMGAYVTYAGRGWTELQNNMNSIERINYYATELDQEPGYNGSDTEREPGCNLLGPVAPPPAPSTWPERGTIIIRDLSMRYRRGLPLALKGINMEVYDGEKIGVVGRSGAGKSSLISALFRLTEPSSGRIFIDAVDIQTLHLSRLRKAIGILPQDPVLFDGTLRTNLDPFHEFSDTEIWDMLDQVCMRSQVALQPARLDMAIGEGGDGLSVGQRQLLCLARVLLRRPRILVLDEATANVDHETDAAIQRVVLSRAQGMTVISIAHRLQTIINYDKVFVVDDGRVVESGTP